MGFKAHYQKATTDHGHAVLKKNIQPGVDLL